MNEWLCPEKLSKEELESVYETKGKKVSAMSDSNRVLQYIYSRLMTHKGGTSMSSPNSTTLGSPGSSPCSLSIQGN